MVNVAVVGATGYTGVELIKILVRHAGVKIVALTTRQKKKISVRELIPTLPKSVNLAIETYSFAKVKRADVVFLCLPHTEAAETAVRFRKAGKIVIDLSADFRLKSAEDYKKWYGLKHKHSAWLKKAVYGLPELNRKKIASADLIANPGCYPTAAILGVMPLLKKKCIDPATIVIDAKSGVSGAGRNPKSSTHFCQVDGNFLAYKVGKHQHTPEINQALNQVSKSKVNVTFTTHLLPVERGILATIYLDRKKGIRPKAILKALHEAYQSEPFVRIRPEGELPSIKDVEHTNYCDIGVATETSSGKLIIVSVIDNLVKGASGQAVQNMNIRLDFPEDEGLIA